MMDLNSLFSFQTEPLPNVFRTCVLKQQIEDFPANSTFSAIAFEPEANKLHFFQKTQYLDQVACIVLE